MRFLTMILFLVAVAAHWPGSAAFAQASATEIEFWQSVKNSNDPSELNAYLEAFPDGAFAPLAKIRLGRLQPGGAKPRIETAQELPAGASAFPDDRGWLGVEITDLNKATAEALGRPDFQGALVLDMLAGAPALGAFRRGDLIIEANGKPVTRSRDLVATVSAATPGTAMAFRVVRDRAEHLVQATPGGYVADVSQRAEAGSTVDIIRLGNAYRTGYGVAQDLEQAVRHFRRAWGAGSLDGGFWLARSYAEGWGLPQDRERAADLMLELAAQGHSGAQAQAAFNILSGIGAEDSVLLALAYAEAAEKDDVAFGIYMMGYISEGVEGIPGSDRAKAIAYYRRAAQRGVDGALQNLERLGEAVFPVAEIQQHLSDLGLYSGRPDGVLGPRTRKAIRAFEALAGLPETGEIGEAMARRLAAVAAGGNRLDAPKNE